jgi:hypothetical protein
VILSQSVSQQLLRDIAETPCFFFLQHECLSDFAWVPIQTHTAADACPTMAKINNKAAKRFSIT